MPVNSRMPAQATEWPDRALLSTTCREAMIAVRQEEQKLMTVNLELTVSCAVQSQDHSMNRRKCKASLTKLFGSKRVEHHNDYWRSEIVRIVAQCKEMSPKRLDRLVIICESEGINTQVYNPVSNLAEPYPVRTHTKTLIHTGTL